MADTLTTPRAPVAGPKRWTCPFCPLLCDTATVQVDDTSGTLTLADTGCARARAALARFSARPSAASAQVQGRDCALDDAVTAAAGLLAASRQPLFGGLGTDVAGARALYRLACRTGAISDAAEGAALMHGVRALQDRGSFFTTLAEVRTRADLIVCVGGTPVEAAPTFFDRCGVGEPLVARRHVVVLGGDAADDAVLTRLGTRPGITVASIPLERDLYTTVAVLCALVAGRAARDVPDHLASLASRLHAARYAVVVAETGRLDAHGALLVEAVHRVVNTLNLTTRAAALWLGGGAGTVNQVYSWLSGLPLRTRAGPRGLEHEPWCFDAQRLLDTQGVDSLLWVSSFDPDLAPPATTLPTIVIGHPELARVPAAVYIPVSTPGIGSAGHLFRADGSVMLPLHALYDDTLPTLSGVLDRIAQVHGLKAPA